MSKVAVTGNNSGTGVFTIAAPNSNTDRTFNLPDEAGTVLTDVSDIESQVKTATNATGSAPVYACRAWVNFDGTGTVSIRDSGNVSSITDNGTGDYNANFINAMPDSDYSAVASAGNSIFHNARTRPILSSNSINIGIGQSGEGFTDESEISVAVFR